MPVAPLQPIPAVEEPFSRVIVDCVGRLPKTKAGNQYLQQVPLKSLRFVIKNDRTGTPPKRTIFVMHDVDVGNASPCK